MKEKDLKYDRKKHVCYSKSIKKVIREHIAKHCADEDVEKYWEKTQQIYVQFLSDLGYLGAKKCIHNRAGGTYDCIAMFAFYEAMDDKPSVDELYEMNNSIFLPSFYRLGKIVNANKPTMHRLMNKIFTMSAKGDKKLEKTCPTGYIMDVEPFDTAKGIRYKFWRCPIAEFAKAHGYTHLMPAFCNGDYPAMEALHAKLIRTTTCAIGDYCDYHIVGDKSPIVAQNPEHVDDMGFVVNSNIKR